MHEPLPRSLRIERGVLALPDGRAVRDHDGERGRALFHQRLVRVHGGDLSFADGRDDARRRGHRVLPRQTHLDCFRLDRLSRPQRGSLSLCSVSPRASLMFGLLAWYGGRMAWDDYRYRRDIACARHSAVALHRVAAGAVDVHRRAAGDGMLAHCTSAGSQRRPPGLRSSSASSSRSRWPAFRSR